MELELPDLVEWNEKWKKEIDDLVGKSDLYITQDDLLLDELENKLQYVPDNEFNDKLRQKRHRRSGVDLGKDRKL